MSGVLILRKASGISEDEKKCNQGGNSESTESLLYCVSTGEAIYEP